MPPRCPASSGKEPKHQKKVMTLHEKVELLDMVKEGKSYAVVGHHYRVNESTAHYIKRNEKAIRSSVASNFCGSADGECCTKLGNHQDEICLCILDTRLKEEKYPFGHKDNSLEGTEFTF